MLATATQTGTQKIARHSTYTYAKSRQSRRSHCLSSAKGRPSKQVKNAQPDGVVRLCRTSASRFEENTANTLFTRLIIFDCPTKAARLIVFLCPTVSTTPSYALTYALKLFRIKKIIQRFKVIEESVVTSALTATTECLKLNATLPTIHSDEENNWLTRKHILFLNYFLSKYFSICDGERCKRKLLPGTRC